jgi:hypothetical protein
MGGLNKRNFVLKPIAQVVKRQKWLAKFGMFSHKYDQLVFVEQALNRLCTTA